jgi:signal transduction histidine kinase/ligand-binding sensor domain-containing protein/DNA-binding response OmpR family regulator
MRLFSITFFFLLLLRLSAQPSSITQLGVEQGLSNNHVVSITQDKDGFLWFATEEGLNKFDGVRFTSFYKYTNDISGNELNYVLADENNPVIWIATQRDGLNAYNYVKDSVEVFQHSNKDENSLITNDVTSIAHSWDGNLWLSTYHRGVEYFDKRSRSFAHYNTATLSGLPSDNVWTVLDDQDGHLFIGHVSDGLSVLTLGSNLVKNYRHDPANAESIPGNEVRRVYKDRHQNIWVGTDKGLVLFNAEREIFIKPDVSADSPLNSAIFDVRQTEDNKLWITTELNGVYVLDLRQHFFTSPTQLNMQHYTVGYNRNSLSNPTVRCVFQDSFSNIWLGTYGGGINFIGHEEPLFNKYSFSPVAEDTYAMNNRMALSLALDGENKLWIGTDGGGINVFEKGKRIHLFSKESGDLSHNTIQALFKDSFHNIWIGSFMGGVNFYDHQSKRFRSLSLDGRNNQDTRCFFEDNDKHIWIGTSTGIFLFDAKEQKQKAHFTSIKNGLPEDLVRSMGQDKKGRMWIGTFGRGLAVFTPEMEPLQYFHEQNGFSSNSINYIFVDSHDRVWVATGEGLACFAEGDSFEYHLYGREDGLMNTYIRAITEDKDHNIWFSTNMGVSCYVSDSGTFQHYGHLDKIPMSSFLNAVVKDNDNGVIYFGSVNGVYFFKPFAVLQEQDVPPAIVTEVRVYEPGTSLGEELILNYFEGDNRKIRLNHKQNSFSISFNVQDYSLIDRIDYVYRLKGVEDTWHEIAENSVTFRNIPPGNYQFQVSARLKNQLLPDDVYTLSIRIEPPFWFSWWAKTIYGIIIASILASILYFYKKRVDIQSFYEMEKRKHAHEQELNDERLRFYTNITHELRTPLTLIIGPLDDLKNDPHLPPKQHQKIALVRQSALRLLDLINQLMEFRKTETQNKKLCVSKANMAELVREVGLKYKELNMKPGVEIITELEREEMMLYFDREVVNTILDNLMTNAMKNTERGKITLSLYSFYKNDHSYTEIKVEDTGYGIPEEELDLVFERYYQVRNNKQASGTGIGLALIKKLAEVHEGTIGVVSEINKGSSFRFTIRTQNSYPDALHADNETTGKGGIGDVEAFDPDKKRRDREKQILLVVEDNKEIRDYIAESLSDTFDVITAGEGEEGCTAAFGNIPDIIISDIMMPGMDGIAFCKRIKEDVRTSHIPLILLTAKTTLQDKEEGYVSGADSYLTKPFSASLLRSRIDNLLENRRKLAEQFKLNINLDSKSVLLNKSLNQLDSEFIANVTRLIEENVEQEKIDVGFLSDALSMSNSTLYRKMKALTGISTNEFIRKIKMSRAEQLLLTGKFTVSEVGYQVGMNSPVYFRQCFKEEFGMAPTDYLKKIKEDMIL